MNETKWTVRRVARVIAALGLAVTLSGCVVYTRPWHPYYWHPY